MAQFLDLPRELRDMIYLEVITAERPMPTLGGAQWLFRFRRVFEPQSSLRGEYGCAYSLEKPPGTCANLLQCNRQIFAEMTETIWRARKKGRASVKLDCIAEDESFHYFTWLRIPLVETSTTANAGKSRIMPAWADGMLRRYSGCLACQRSTTLITQLWVDVRLVGDRSGKFFRNGSAPDRTSWAICAALKRIFEKGPDFASLKDAGMETTIDELVLNVVTPPNVPKEKYLAEDYDVAGPMDGLVHPRTVARELVNVWQKIWSGDDFKGVFYQMLLERIKRVRVCVDGQTWKTRELRLELERGQQERNRIAQRVGW
ncbi:hypothetical protein K505DRAFT_328521 [Melanomma pulvis-pyrius CBS 109.77]|uniref:F-box domain-containing protein n=1 Tax=Melanomma pulvis-pyrius CBS 109.77 TaxID=1314802 RepID=A0A6A6WYN3_9PLEO|nr:hypothetical protein K505DRAFT_328521 [Melanomma pulvis-pyrius CBS 109.77]